MKFTIITVSFNSEKTIADTLKSVALQTYENIEYIIIDGASTDSTVSIINDHSNNKFRLISEPDLGIYNAMNKGLNMATGDYIGFLNADDVFSSEDAILKLSILAKNNPTSDILYSDLAYVSSVNLHKYIRKWTAGNLSPGKLEFGWMPPHPTFYITKNCLQLIKNFNENYHISADYDFMLRAIKSCNYKTSYLPEVLVLMRMGGISNNSLKSILLKSKEDWLIIRRNNIGHFQTLLMKNLRKLPQFL